MNIRQRLVRAVGYHAMGHPTIMSLHDRFLTLA